MNEFRPWLGIAALMLFVLLPALAMVAMWELSPGILAFMLVGGGAVALAWTLAPDQVDRQQLEAALGSTRALTQSVPLPAVAVAATSIPKSEAPSLAEVVPPDARLPKIDLQAAFARLPAVKLQAWTLSGPAGVPTADVDLLMLAGVNPVQELVRLETLATELRRETDARA